MKLLKQDIYMECTNLKNVVNVLYVCLDMTKLTPLEVIYVNDCYKYINKHTKIRIQLIKQYIIDLKTYLNY